MSRRAPVAAAVLFTALTLFAQAADFPRKPIRIVTADAGGGSDFVARLIGQGWTAAWGQQVVVDNRGGGTIAGDIVAHAAPDGYTLLYYGPTLWLLPLMRKEMPYDTLRDFAPVTLAVSTPAVLVVHPSVAAKSVRELIALAKAMPGKLNYAAAAAGTATHLSAELFKAMAGVDIVRIPYKGTGAALNDLLGGQTQLMFAVAASVVAHARAGRLRALAVTGPTPSAALPELPTVAASGLPGFESVQHSGLFAPAKTSQAIIDTLRNETVNAVNRSEARERLANLGVDAIASTPAEFAAKIRSEISVLGKVIRDAGIRAD
jgi:tripartite-type tricarboxylate transporter receptor subunit TctC